MNEFTKQEKELIKDGTKLYALELSLKKQEDIVAGTGFDLNSLNCALCVKYHDEDIQGDECRECPLDIAGYGCNHPDSPWVNDNHEKLVRIFKVLIEGEKKDDE